MPKTNYHDGDDVLRETWRSLVITRALTEGLLKVILRTGTEVQKALAHVLLDDAREAQDDWAFQVQLPKDLGKLASPDAQVRIASREPRSVQRACLRCNKKVWLETPFRQCLDCRSSNSMADMVPHSFK